MTNIFIYPTYLDDNESYSKYIKDFESLNIKYDNLHIYKLNEIESYKTYKLNTYHFKPESYFTKIIPDIVNSFSIFNKDDFEIISKYDGKNDISYFIPKIGNLYTVELDNITYDCNYSGLIGFDNEYAKTIYSEYHKIFVGAHSCGKIINHTIKNNKTLLVSCDSISIPVIPILSCYFLKVIFLDNRTDRSFKYLYLNENIADKLYMLFTKHDVNKFIIDNFK